MAEISSKDHKIILAERLNSVSTMPGVYLMRDTNNKVIYTGKAKNLKKRLASYFKRADHHDMKTGVLVKKIVSFDTIVTATEQEALILEANLIAKYKPRYNIILKDDKRYPSLRINIKEAYPNITIVRKIKKDDALYFGPYASSSSMHQTLKIINKSFKLRKCKTKKFAGRSRPCLNYQIGVCLAPCCLEVDNDKYRKIINEVALLLRGKTSELIKNIKNEMLSLADKELYEEAAQLRDKVFALEKTLEKQVVVTSDLLDRDVLALTRGEELSLITILSVRGGTLSGSRHYRFRETIADDPEIMETFILQYYENAPYVPKEILTRVMPVNLDIIEERLKHLKNIGVRILCPQRGEKVRLVEMASQNGIKELEEQLSRGRSDMEMLLRLRDRLKMDRIPEHIECFDNSNISGTDPVAGMVVFKKGRPNKTSYRKYKIKTVEIQDDYSYMSEILTRRYGKTDLEQPYPDLLIVDGGKGQLNVALAVLKELGIEGLFDVIGIAKKDESKEESYDKIYKPLRSNPVNFGREVDLLLFLQRVRDEAHRFAITFHRSQRDKKTTQSVLDSVPGIGKLRKKAILRHFGGINAVKEASLEELSKLDGMNMKAAKAVLDTLSGK